MTSPTNDSSSEVARKEAKRARKEAKKAKKEKETAEQTAEQEQKRAADTAMAVDAEPAAAAAASPASSPVSTVDDENAEDDAEREAKRARKAAKRARKAAEAAARAEGQSSAAVAPAPSPSPSPSASSSSSSSSSIVASPLAPNRKNFYKPHAKVSALTSAQIDAIRAEHKMTLTGNLYGRDALYAPVTEFAHAGFESRLLACTAGFKAPTGIQAQCWPVLLMGRDTIAIAETGSGKTLGFVLPAIVHILDAAPISSSKKGRDVSNMGPLALVLAPTRELAQQSAEVAEKASACVGLRTTCVYGGVDRMAQRSALARGVHLMVATPGRLVSLMNDHEVSLSRVSFLVLDEADRMLDLGFEEQVRAIITACRSSKEGGRQTLMFSATWPDSVRKLAAQFLLDPVRIDIGKDGSEGAGGADEEGGVPASTSTLAANKRIKQTIEVMDDMARDARLLQILQQPQNKTRKILVFVLYKKEVDKVERLLRGRGGITDCMGMSSDRSQADRQTAIEHFKSGRVRILVATDVAGRGLDIRDIALVINYSFPLTIEDYVHRIGRTGRGGKEGESLTFFTRNEKHLAGELVNVLREAQAVIPDDLLKFGTGVKRKEHSMYGLHYKTRDDERPMKAPTKVKFDD